MGSPKGESLLDQANPLGIYPVVAGYFPSGFPWYLSLWRGKTLMGSPKHLY